MLALVGCGTITPQAIEGKQLESLKNQTLASTAREKSDFAMLTPGSAMVGGLIGGLIMISAGNKLVADHNLQDPAVPISLGLARVLENHQGTRLVAPAIATDVVDAQQIAAAGKGKAKFVLDVKTTGWHASYFPTGWGRYRINYWATARLINVNTQSVIAQGGCRRTPEQTDKSPTYDELWADQATVAKKELELIAQECVQMLATQMFPGAPIPSQAMAPAVATPVSPTAQTPSTALSAAPAAAPATVPAPVAVAAPAAATPAPVTASPAAPAAPAGATVSMPFVPDSKPVGRAAGPAPAAAAPAAQSVPTAATVAVVSPAQPTPATPATATAATPASKKEARLQWLKQMRDANLITSGEYDTKRQQVLSAP
ncbi:hypothetical protein HNP48_000513 [Acidovorax soli]|uniref:SHOCT domain-containing protein n=1 Tax=Acidovorax soli TaxID=592050 RepID=A0A7X0U7M2_9BURK|nr:hypothetical protein [Acidovorax soli]MBB6557849.1 hypothetical protein [Acidovorax soli]